PVQDTHTAGKVGCMNTFCEDAEQQRDITRRGPKSPLALTGLAGIGASPIGLSWFRVVLQNSGPSPAPARAFPSDGLFPLVRLNLGSYKARYPSGKGEVCKTFIRRFDSDPRLHSLLAVA